MPVKYITDWRSKSLPEIIDVKVLKNTEDHIPKSINLPVLNDSRKKSNWVNL